MSANSAIFNPTESTSAATGDGFSVPRLTTTGRLAIVFGTGDKGMMVYDTTLNNLFIWNGSAWESVPASGDSTNTQVIFNDNGILAGDAGLTYDKAQARVQVGTRIDIWRGLNASSTNVAVGRSALSATQAGANANTAVGNQAGLGLTTGANNVFLGANAGFGGGTGGNNVAIGVGALTLNTAGNQNVSIGTNSLFNHTGTGSVAIGNIAGNSSTGNYNTFLGYASGSVATTATQCVAIGVDSFGGGSGRAHTGAYSIAIGATAMYSANDITGADNIGIGRDSLRNLSSGAQNACVGQSSGYRITTATNCVALGNNALSGLADAVTGNNNIGIGDAALYTDGGADLSGTSNIGIGPAAGRRITTGNYNVFVGTFAGFTSTAITGSDNIGLGSNVLRKLEAGTNNIAIGLNSLNLITNGQNNVAIGAGASQNNTANDNVSVGINALNANTSGGLQTAIGRAALVLATGGSNTALGYAAGANITTGTNNICIGVNSSASANNINNELVIGSNGAFVATNGGATTYYNTASAGAVALPAAALGFIRIYLNGSFVKIPVYGN